MNSKLIICIKFAFAIFLLWILYRLKLIQISSILVMIKNPWSLVGLTVLAWFTSPLCTLRWRLLLQVQGIETNFAELFRIVYASSLFGLYLPGVVGGDVVRTVFGSRLSPGKIPKITLSVVFDRLMGVVGLLVLGLAGCFLFFRSFWMNKPLGFFMVLAASLLAIAIFLAVFAVLFSSPLHQLSKRNKWRRRNFFFRSLAQLIEAIISYSKNRKRVLAALVISILVHAKNIVSLLIIAEIVLAKAVEPVGVAISGFVAFLTNFIPLTPGGIGLGEAAFSQIAIMLTPASAETDFGSIFLLHRGLTILALIPAAFAMPRFIGKQI